MKELFDKNKFDKKSIELLNNFVQEFNDIFGKYLSEEEIVKRIENNLEKIELNNESLENSKAVGIYNSKDKRISISDKIKDEKQLKGIFFHEMIHCITANNGKNEVGFRGQHETFAGRKTSGRGFNEGVTEYLSKIRNEKIDGVYEKKAYPILTSLAENIATVYGKDEFLNIFLKSPEAFIDELGKIQYDPETFFESFDIIYNYEKQLYVCEEEKILLSIFGIKTKKDFNDMELEIAKEDLKMHFCTILQNKAKVTNIVEFKQICIQFCKFLSDLNIDSINFMDYDTMISIAKEAEISNVEAIEILEEYGLEPREETLEIESDNIFDFFNISDLGKATINTETKKKDEATKQIQEDLQKMQETNKDR